MSAPDGASPAPRPLAARSAGPGGASEEARLVAAARGGDRAAFGELYRRLSPVVHGVLIAHARPEDARDLVQEVFLRALRALPELEERGSIGAWLCAIARNCARDAHKLRRETGALPDEVAGGERPDAVDDAEEAERVLAALRELPEAYRETLALRLVEGLGGPEIAARTGLTPGSVRVNLCRGMKLLRERLGIEGEARP